MCNSIKEGKKAAPYLASFTRYDTKVYSIGHIATHGTQLLTLRRLHTLRPLCTATHTTLATSYYIIHLLIITCFLIYMIFLKTNLCASCPQRCIVYSGRPCSVTD